MAPEIRERTLHTPFRVLNLFRGTGLPGVPLVPYAGTDLLAGSVARAACIRWLSNASRLDSSDRSLSEMRAPWPRGLASTRKPYNCRTSGNGSVPGGLPVKVALASAAPGRRRAAGCGGRCRRGGRALAVAALTAPARGAGAVAARARVRAAHAGPYEPRKAAQRDTAAGTGEPSRATHESHAEHGSASSSRRLCRSPQPAARSPPPPAPHPIPPGAAAGDLGRTAPAAGGDPDRRPGAGSSSRPSAPAPAAPAPAQASQIDRHQTSRDRPELAPVEALPTTERFLARSASERPRGPGMGSPRTDRLVTTDGPISHPDGPINLSGGSRWR